MAIMISIKPQHCENILNLIKTLEIRKSCPKEWKDYLSGKTKVKPKAEKVLIYCTKPKKWFRYSSCGLSSNELLWKYKDEIKMCDGFEFYGCMQDCEALNGKVVACFTLNEVDKLEFRHLSVSHTNAYIPVNEDADYEWEKHCCVGYDDIIKYGKFAPLYAWHIDDLQIYDVPKELGEFKIQNKCYKSGSYEELGCWECGCALKELGECDGRCSHITRPPQSWCYCEELEEENVKNS